MKDFIKQELNVGGRVVHGVGGRSGGLSGPYYVHSFTPKMARLCRFSRPDTVEKTANSYCLVKVPKNG